MATSAIRSSPKKKPTTKKTVAKKKVVTKKSTKRTVVKSEPIVHKVDYYPNRMTVAVSALAGTVLVLVTLIAVLGVQ
ncbi:MAG: hypothetical protein ABIP74_03395 [Candidatus Saccharimonas sp.]